jgi:3-oxoacyl-[acyl-carrier protein] reductase
MAMGSGLALENKVALITGGGQGIGRGLCAAFVAEGADVLVATRSRANGEETLGDIGAGPGRAALHVVDISVETACREAVDAAVTTFGRLDILVHNAGVYPAAPIADLTAAELDFVLATNLKAAFWLTQAALPHVLKSGAGRLLFTSSVTGPRVAMPGYAAYAASKSGLNGFIRTAALEYAKRNITVNGVEPGYISTPALEAVASEADLQDMSRMIPMGRFGTIMEVANVMVFLASEAASYITGQTIVIDGGSTLPESQKIMDMF